jgi:hypothetical protein
MIFWILEVEWFFDDFWIVEFIWWFLWEFVWFGSMETPVFEFNMTSIATLGFLAREVTNNQFKRRKIFKRFLVIFNLMKILHKNFEVISSPTFSQLFQEFLHFHFNSPGSNPKK